MNVVILLVFVSLLLVVAALVFMVYGMRQGDLDHGERLSLLPLTDERQTRAVPSSEAATRRAPGGSAADRQEGKLNNQGRTDP